MTLAERLAELVSAHGSLREVARLTKCDVGYLSRLASGEKSEPTDEYLRRLGLRRLVTYERLKP